MTEAILFGILFLATCLLIYVYLTDNNADDPIKSLPEELQERIAKERAKIGTLRDQFKYDPLFLLIPMAIFSLVGLIFKLT